MLNLKRLSAADSSLFMPQSVHILHCRQISQPILFQYVVHCDDLEVLALSKFCAITNFCKFLCSIK
jgi:hypothetical protein